MITRGYVLVSRPLDNVHDAYIHEVIPMELERCIFGMKRNLKHVLEIAESAADPRTKLQALAIANDCYRYIIDLTTNGVVVTDAIKYVNQKQEQIDTLHKLDERIEAAEEAEETTTSNGVYSSPPGVCFCPSLIDDIQRWTYYILYPLLPLNYTQRGNFKISSLNSSNAKTKSFLPAVTISDL